MIISCGSMAITNVSGGRMTPAGLAAALTSIYGAGLIGLWLGEDLVVDGSGNVTSWPGRVGGTLTNLTANRFSATSFSVRRALSPLPTIAQAKSLGLDNGVAFKSVMVVASGSVAVSSYEMLVDRYDAATRGVLCREASTAVWRTADGWTQYVDGIAASAIPTTGEHVIESVKAANTYTGVNVGGWATGNRCWPVPIGCALYLSGVSTAQQRALANIALKTYYRIA